MLALVGRVLGWIAAALALWTVLPVRSSAPPAVPELPSQAWQGSIEEQLAAHEYRASRNSDGLQAPNRAHNLRTYFDAHGVRVHDRTAEGAPELLTFALTAVGRGEQRGAIDAGEVRADGARVEIRRDGLVEWYL